MPKLSMQPKTANPTLDELFNKFIAFKKIRNLSQESIDYYEKCYWYFTDFYAAELPCSDITKDVCLGYIQYLRQTRPNLKDVTLNTYLRGVRALVYYGMELGYLPRFKLELVKADKELKETYTDEELALLLKKPDIAKCGFTEYRNWVVVNYLLATGNRLLINISIISAIYTNAMRTPTKIAKSPFPTAVYSVAMVSPCRIWAISCAIIAFNSSSLKVSVAPFVTAIVCLPKAQALTVILSITHNSMCPNSGFCSLAC